ncbi:MAG: hypothetical protein QMB03_10535 [Spirosomataceae bacterium]|jgi:hypothetical protein
MKISGNSLIINYEADKSVTKITLTQTADWQLKLQFPKRNFKERRINGKVVKPTAESNLEYTIIDSRLTDIIFI